MMMAAATPSIFNERWVIALIFLLIGLCIGLLLGRKE